MATRRGRPTQAETKNLDLAVHEAAVATFVELGYAGASMEAIAMILVSYAVNVFKQNRIPDSGAAFFDMVAEPVV
jgi:TetR/AcrR family transcriptional regulator, mexJK operon transcriptional repressor